MATKRFGYLDDLSLKNQKVGIGTSTANEKLEVLGGSRSKDIKVTGIATLTSYEGFQNTNFTTTDNVLIGGGESGTLSGEVVIGTGTTLSVGTGATTGQGSIDSLKVSNTFNPPIGGTNDRPSAPKPGALFYNKEYRTIEYWDGNFWRQVDNVTSSGRAIFCGGSEPSVLALCDYLTVPTQGNAQNFGNLTVAREGTGLGTVSSKIRGISFAGWTGSPAGTDVIDYNTMASKGNAIDFGNATSARGWGAGMSSSTRGIDAGGYPGTSNVIDYIEIGTLGDAIDFGDLPTVKESCYGMSSPTRGIIGTGMSPTYVATLDYITMASKGNAVIFGHLGSIRGHGAAANTTRGLFAGGKNPGTLNLNAINMVTIASTGNAVDFGELSQGRRKPAGASTSVRAVFAGGNVEPSGKVNTVDFISFSSSGLAADFGDLTDAREVGNTNADSHGGLGGY